MMFDLTTIQLRNLQSMQNHRRARDYGSPRIPYQQFVEIHARGLSNPVLVLDRVVNPLKYEAHETPQTLDTNSTSNQVPALQMQLV